MIRSTTLQRSKLGLPANEQQLVTDAMESNADELFFDLEDSLAPGEKQPARSTFIDTVRANEWANIGLSYRINGTNTQWWYDDVIEIVSAVGEVIDTLIIPKVQDPTEVQTVESLVSSIEANVGMERGSIGLSAQIETAAGMNNVVDIAHASDRLTGIIFGPADYAASVGATHGASEYPGHYWYYPLSRIAHAAASANLAAIGGPYANPDDLEGFQEACVREQALGYDGKIVIHPEQIETANDVFSPDTQDVQRAKQVAEAYEQTGTDAVATIDGNVIDREMYRMAERILTKAAEADQI